MSSDRLYISNDFEEAWQALILPWAQAHLSGTRPLVVKTAIICPSDALVACLKQHLLDAGFSIVGAFFLTPGSLRLHLLNTFKVKSAYRPLALREDLHLLVQSVAECLSNNPTARVVARDPALFMGLYDILASVGRSAESLPSDSLKEIARAFEQRLSKARLRTTQQTDGWLLKSLKNHPPIFDTGLFYGFTTMHWPLFSLLRAAMAATQQVDCCLIQGHDDRADSSWLGTWEEHLGSALPLPAKLECPRPFEPLVRRIELCSPAASGSKADQRAIIRIGVNLKAEAEAVCMQALSFLSQEQCSRLGIVFAQASPLVREVAALLTQRGVPHHDTLGYLSAATAEQQLLGAWVQFQQKRQYDALCNFIEALRSQNGLTAPQAQCCLRGLQSALVDVRTDDYAVLAAKAPAVVRDLPGAGLLPCAATLEDFLSKTFAVLCEIGCSSTAEQLKLHAHRCSHLHSVSFSRENFLSWLWGILQKPVRARSSLGQHPFARVQLLTIQDAVGQNWSHLILAGLNNRQWPPEISESALMPDAAINALNALTLRQGKQGEGHLIAPSGYLLSAQERRKQSRNTFTQLIESVRVGFAVTASFAEGPEFRRSAGLSDLLIRLHKAQEGIPLTPQRLQAYLAATEEARKQAAKEIEPVPLSKPAVGAMLHAWQVRRKPEQPFGEFEYAFREPPEGGLNVSCKAWESILQRPAASWYKYVLNIPSQSHRRKRAQGYRSLSRGIWVHDWLRLSTLQDKLERLPQKAEWHRRIGSQAQQFRSEVENAYKGAGRRLPERWQVEWQQALWCAQRLSSTVAEHYKGFFALSEYTLPSDCSPDQTEGSLPTFPLRGRIDLLLAAEPSCTPKGRLPWPSTSPLSIIDYKTGAQVEALNPRSLLQGKGLQQALYTLALSRCGYKTIDFALLGTADGLMASGWKPQMCLAQIYELTELWEALTAIHYSGVLGQGVASHFHSQGTGANDYPIAVLPIDPTILREKWGRTHPQLPVPREV